MKSEAASSRDHNFSSTASNPIEAAAPSPVCNLPHRRPRLSLADGAIGTRPSCRVPTNSEGGPHGPGMLPVPGTGAAPVCCSRSATNPSRAAVTGVTSRAGAQATPSAASGLTARAAHNPSPSAGSGAARPADIPAKRSPFAVDAPDPLQADALLLRVATQRSASGVVALVTTTSTTDRTTNPKETK